MLKSLWEIIEFVFGVCLLMIGIAMSLAVGIIMIGLAIKFVGII